MKTPHSLVTFPIAGPGYCASGWDGDRRYAAIERLRDAKNTACKAGGRDGPSRETAIVSQYDSQGSCREEEVESSGETEAAWRRLYNALLEATIYVNPKTQRRAICIPSLHVAQQ
ncbi:hypothetical protein GGX14DRAFT_390922 [Mycena pura]|uniref:Uncharacterized protein n=1 Tax=Mycena pura TaxID=153505 RepID=A0AAD6YJV7_9AGAR|nr:hypothetical protein GGX14DRAFT_390922 [Mycena pura]